MQNGQKLIPSVTRVVQQGPEYVRLPSGVRAGGTRRSAVSGICESSIAGKARYLKPSPMKVMQGLDNRLKTMPMEFSIPLNRLPAGRYNCQVTVLDPTGQKAAFGRLRSCSCRKTLRFWVGDGRPQRPQSFIFLREA